MALAVAGFAWSALYWLVAVPIGGDTAPVTAAVLMAVAGVALSGLSTLPAGYAAFTTAMLLPTAILLVASGNASYFALGLTVALYTLSMNLLALRSCRQFERHALLDIARLAAETRFREIAAASGDWFWESDAQGRLTWISESVERAMGYSRNPTVHHNHPFGSGQTSLQITRMIENLDLTNIRPKIFFDS